jgi:hypothetical protein
LPVVNEKYLSSVGRDTGGRAYVMDPWKLERERGSRYVVGGASLYRIFFFLLSSPPPF